MSWENSHSRLLSAPIDLYWQGWRANTRELQSAGWMLSADQDVYDHRMRLAFRHRGCGMMGITDSVPFEYGLDYDPYPHRQGLRSRITMSCDIGNHVMVQTNHSMNFIPIDAEPAYTMEAPRSLEDLAHFQIVNRNAKQVFLEKASMEEILAAALSRQAPRQEEIRREMMKRKEMDKYKRYGQLSAELRLVA